MLAWELRVSICCAMVMRGTAVTSMSMTPAAAALDTMALPSSVSLPTQEMSAFWLRRNGVDTNGATAKAMIFVRSGKKVGPGTFGEIKVG